MEQSPAEVDLNNRYSLLDSDFPEINSDRPHSSNKCRKPSSTNPTNSEGVKPEYSLPQVNMSTSARVPLISRSLRELLPPLKEITNQG